MVSLIEWAGWGLILYGSYELSTGAGLIVTGLLLVLLAAAANLQKLL